MSLELELPEVMELRPRITVVGVGGAGGNAINNMIAAGLDGVDFVVANTDAQAIAMSSAEQRIQLGRHLTEGLGAGSKPEIGEAAAEEAIDEIKSVLDGSHMVFVAAGMGGGTGTGAAAVVARAAKELGILTVGVVTKPFQFEGARRMRIAEQGIHEIRQQVDTLIVIPNQNLFRVANEKTTFAEAFVLADQVLHAGVACITDLIVREGLINLDFADVNTVMKNMGTAMMGTGEAEGDRRAIEAAEEAIANPLLSELSMKGAKGLLVSITGGQDMTLYEVDEAASRVREEVDPEANIIVGATFDQTLTNKLRVSIVASGIEARPAAQPSRVAAAPQHAAPAKGSGEQRQQPSHSGVPQRAAASAGTVPQSTPAPSQPQPMRPVQAQPPQGQAPQAQQPQTAMPPGAKQPGRLVEKLGDVSADHTRPVQGQMGRTIALEHSDEVRPAETWSGPGNVTIEKSRPALANAEFTPRQPAPVERMAQPVRAPANVSVKDFDRHGQKVYANGSAGSQKPDAIREPQKQGFFARLRGKKTESNESFGADLLENRSVAHHEIHENDSIQPDSRHVTPGSQGVSSGRRAVEQGGYSGEKTDELPHILKNRAS